MSALNDLADTLAQDTLKHAASLGDEDEVIRAVAKRLGASSTTMEEAFMTSIRMRLAERRARNFLEEQIERGSLIQDSGHQGA